MEVVRLSSVGIGLPTSTNRTMSPVPSSSSHSAPACVRECDVTYKTAALCSPVLLVLSLVHQTHVCHSATMSLVTIVHSAQPYCAILSNDDKCGVTYKTASLCGPSLTVLVLCWHLAERSWKSSPVVGHASPITEINRAFGSVTKI